MVTCPWCGTNYKAFRPNCDNCGGTLSLPEEKPAEVPEERITVPPPPPRNVPKNYVLRVLSTDGWAITGFVFFLIGAIFAITGIALTIPIITAFVGIPFAGMGIVFFAGGLAALIWRYQEVQKTVAVLKEGEAVLGEIDTVRQNLYVRINGRYPWTITYLFQLGGKDYRGKVTTLSQPDLGRRPGRGVYVLYSRDDPTQNTIYPHPYGYYVT
jgi:hypothetical protein